MAVDDDASGCFIAVYVETWLSSLWTKFKMERLKLRDLNDAVRAAREKFGHKRPASLSTVTVATTGALKMREWKMRE